MCNRVVAVLMPIYKDNSQVHRLIKHLSKDFDIYIHIDARTNIDVKNFKSKNVYVFKTYKVYWGSYYFALAIMKLFNEAVKENYQRYMFITGEDLPLKSNKEILEFFTDNDNEYIRYWRFPVPHWRYDNGGFDRVMYYHSNRIVLNRKGVNKKDYVIYKIKEFLFYNPLKYIMEQLKIHRTIEHLYYGSISYMFLTNNAVRQMVQYMQLHPNFMKGFNHTLICDEVFLATFLLNYTHNLHIVNDSQFFIEFEGSHPRIFKIEDFNRLMQSNKLFARKFDYQLDNNIINKIYERIGE